ncbi:MAG: NAD(P)(+) transhydrogenase (Re/Si-specific) subunit alpha, partial [Gemmatimonadota bacterium]
ETVVAHGVQIIGPTNLPATVPVHASQMYSKNITTLLGEFVGEEGAVTLDFETDVIGPATVTHEGEVKNDRVRQAMQPSA